MATALALSLLVVPVCSAAEAAGAETRSTWSEMWSRLVGWMNEEAGSLTAVWAAEGSGIDPDGRPTSIHPPGRTGSASSIDEGPDIDPNGHPR